MSVRFLTLDPTTDDSERMLLVLVANQCARLFELAQSSVAFPFCPADVVAHGDTMKTGALLAAVELRDLLCKFGEGRQALRDLGFEPVLEQSKGE